MTSEGNEGLVLDHGREDGRCDKKQQGRRAGEQEQKQMRLLKPSIENEPFSYKRVRSKAL